MKLKSFGCSFIYGSDHTDIANDKHCNIPSQTTWPALLSKRLGTDYLCYARPGIGNLHILETVLTQAASNDNAIFVIGWTWIDRFDYTNTQDSWQTILPVDDTALANTYYRELHSQYRDKLTTLIQIQTAIDTLNRCRIPFIMTYMDELILETEWHTNPAITSLQNYVFPYLTKFEGATFLDWSRKNNYSISTGLHPLEHAHKHAANYLIDKIISDLK